MPTLRPAARAALAAGGVIVAHPLALTPERRLDERRQRALTRYYRAAGAMGVAVGVHTTQFAIRRPGVDLLRPVLRLARTTLEAEAGGERLLRVAGVCGPREQALAEAGLAADEGYDLALVSLAGVGDDEADLVAHLRAVGEILPVFAFYLQPAVGGRPLTGAFWRAAADLRCVAAVKLAPFDRYATLAAVRGVLLSERRDEVALYTGNDDHIVWDLMTTFELEAGGGVRTARFAGGLLGQWAVGTRAAVDLWRRTRRARDGGDGAEIRALLAQGVRLTDLNAALFDPQHAFRGSIPGLSEVLRRQGLMAGTWCVDPEEVLSPGQAAEIDRVTKAYPELLDGPFIEAGRQAWLEP